jgi:hypothetical protein
MVLGYQAEAMREQARHHGASEEQIAEPPRRSRRGKS